MGAPAQVVYEYLTEAGTGLYTLCANRCWFGWKPDAVTWNNEAPAIIFGIQNDGANAPAGRREGFFYFRVYGGSNSADSVETVVQALQVRLGHARRAVTTSGILQRAALTGGSQVLKDPDTEYPYAVQLYEIDTT